MENKKHISMTDVYVCIIVLLFTFFVDIVYPVFHIIMNTQISDYWLVVNVIFYAIELVCITIYNGIKRLNPEQKDVYKEISYEVGKGAAEGVANIIGTSIQMPTLTSGSKGEGWNDSEAQDNSADTFDNEEDIYLGGDDENAEG